MLRGLGSRASDFGKAGFAGCLVAVTAEPENVAHRAKKQHSTAVPLHQYYHSFFVVLTDSVSCTMQLTALLAGLVVILLALLYVWSRRRPPIVVAVLDLAQHREYTRYPEPHCIIVSGIQEPIKQLAKTIANRPGQEARLQKALPPPELIREYAGLLNEVKGAELYQRKLQNLANIIERSR